MIAGVGVGVFEFAQTVFYLWLLFAVVCWLLDGGKYRG